jgi:cysteine synthase A
MIYESISQLIGNTPLLLTKKYNEKNARGEKILCKLEYLNPAGSAKDRPALHMINTAEENGLINKDGSTVIIEPTSGNTGIGLAAIAASRGYRIILTMPESMSMERRKLLAAYGAEIVLTDARLGMKGAIDKANELASSFPSAFIPSQFDNPANPEAHKNTTGAEIWRDTDGKVDIFIAGIGTGGTISGVAAYLKEKNSAVQIVGIEPSSSPLISKGKTGLHGLQGIGANFIPETLDRSVVDEVLTVSTEEAYAAGRRMGKEEGILAGISSGAALCAALRLAKDPANAGKTIVALLPDSGERYLTTAMYEE